MSKLRAALILDNLNLKAWQKVALAEAADLLDIKLVLNCENATPEKKQVKHFIYHTLTRFALNNSFTKSSKYTVTDQEVLDFNAVYEKGQQSIPKNILQHLKDERIDIVIKFGMAQLKAYDTIEDFAILSYRHGNPAKFRGRATGFYELLHNADNAVLMVQKLASKPADSEVLALAESKLVYYSYKKSAELFYKQAQYLLRKAIINFKANRSISVDNNGKKYSLPSNFLAFQFFVILLSKRIKHIGYGAFFEKKWKVGTAKVVIKLQEDNILDSASINEFAIEPEYNFYADPFFSLDGTKVRLEALSNQTGLGDIIEFELENPVNPELLLSGAHYSYPFSFLLDGDEHLLPEVASHSPQYFFDLADDQKEQVVLKGLEEKRLADATLLKHDDWWYLFFGDNKSAHSLLNLWVSDSVTGEFKEHPSSPVCLSPCSARMAGRILLTEDGLFRFGQKNNRAYGAAVTISEITELSPEWYEEQVCGSISIDDCLGPHSIDFNKDKGIALIDYYTDEFSLFAGVRRLKALLAKS